jgi:hypothetical protein
MTDKISLADLLHADPADSGCRHGFENIDQYVELELAGQDATAHFPGLAAHLRSCPACRLDHEGMLIAARAER